MSPDERYEMIRELYAKCEEAYNNAPDSDNCRLSEWQVYQYIENLMIMMENYFDD